MVFLWSGPLLMAGLFMLVLLWSVLPFGGETLPHLLEQTWNIAFRSSALIVSLACGLLAVGSMSLTLLIPCPETVDQPAERKHTR